MTEPVVIGIVEQQPNLLTYAIRAARETRSPLRVVHSTGVPAQAADFYASPELLNELRSGGQAVLADAKHVIEQEGPDLVVEYVLCEEPPVQALEHTSADARLLVVGADDVTWFERLLRGSVSGRLARHARCPVVVVPKHAGPDRYEGDIIVILDGDTSADGPIRFGFERAAARSATLHLLQVQRAGTPALEIEAIEAHLGEVVAGWRESYPDTVVLTSFSAGDPETSIAQATQAAGLVIVGRPHGGVVPVLTGSLATDLLRRAHCPVAIVPASYAGV